MRLTTFSPSSKACTASASRILARSSVNGIDRKAVARLFCRMANSSGCRVRSKVRKRALIGGDRIGDAGAAGAGEALQHEAEIHLGLRQLLRRAGAGKNRDRLLDRPSRAVSRNSVPCSGMAWSAVALRAVMRARSSALVLRADGERLVVKLDGGVELIWGLGALLEADGDLHQHLGALGWARRLVLGHRQGGADLLCDAMRDHSRTSQLPALRRVIGLAT